MTIKESREVTEATDALVGLVEELCTHEAYTEYRTYDVYVMERKDERRIRDQLAALVEAVRKDEREGVEGLVFALVRTAEEVAGASWAFVDADALRALYHWLSPEHKARLVGEAAPAEGGTEG